MKKTDAFDENEPLLECGGLPEDAWRLPQAPEELREDMLARTSALARGRGRRRRALFAGAIAAAYAAGLVTAFVVLTEVTEGERAVPAVAEASQEEPVISPEPEQPAVAPDPVREPEEFALLLARAPRDEKLVLLKATGDRYLNEFGDVEVALNYYRRLLALELSGEDAQPSLDDTWLLRSLKQARLQEEHHENANS